MLNSISRLGKELNKDEQKNINGGWRHIRCFKDSDCPPWDSFCLNGYCQYM
ncbi:hypothetical protein [uncultured Tenacibaculum sp.]|uniref:hypothetical protein n=1 Tax=uncultured Tenacibaculum sp. TaxID=174713 RepID=UPI002614F1C5|nr:hypothetical protein [uncultured Tenacibaculum sp.]